MSSFLPYVILVLIIISMLLVTRLLIIQRSKSKKAGPVLPDSSTRKDSLSVPYPAIRVDSASPLPPQADSPASKYDGARI